jgi:hypothetical protein
VSTKRKIDKSEHPDVQIRDVLAQAPNGEWLKFDTLFEAKILLMPEHQKNIFRNLEDFQKRVSSHAMSELMGRFETQSASTIWEKLLIAAKNPYRKNQAVLEADTLYKQLGKRVRRPRVLKYQFNLNAKDQRTVDAYYRLPPQAQAVVDLIEAYVHNFNKPVVLETELKEYFEKNGEKLQTKQDPWRIFQYYRGRLIANGFLRFAR